MRVMTSYVLRRSSELKLANWWTNGKIEIQLDKESNNYKLAKIRRENTTEVRNLTNLFLVLRLAVRSVVQNEVFKRLLIT